MALNPNKVFLHFGPRRMTLRQGQTYRFAGTPDASYDAQRNQRCLDVTFAPCFYDHAHAARQALILNIRMLPKIG